MPLTEMYETVSVLVDREVVPVLDVNVMYQVYPSDELGPSLVTSTEPMSALASYTDNVKLGVSLQSRKLLLLADSE